MNISSPSEKLRLSRACGYRMRFRDQGFSLIELLTVIGVMAILVSVAGPTVSSISKGSQMNQALTEVGGLLEEARQYAIAKNTYVWVAFNDTPDGIDDQLKVAILASKSGTDLPSWGVDDATASSARTQLLNRVRTFKQVKLSGAGTFNAGQIPTLPSVPNTGDPGVANFTVGGLNGSPEKYSKAIQFTPAGEARNASTMIGMIELGLQPSRNKVADTSNVAAVQVNGLTGQSTIFRP